MTAREELDAFESQFRPAIIPPGTPDRKRLQREAWEVAHRSSCEPQNVARRLELLAAVRRERRSESAKRAAARRTSDPIMQTRAWLFRWLRQLGFKREHSSSSKSAYYVRLDATGLRVRVSDHDVPMTPEREWNMEHGGWSWARQGWQFDLRESRMELARHLVELRQAIRAFETGNE